MILAAAQFNARSGDINTNLEEHYRLIEKAALKKVALIVFPEMSITSYERTQAASLAFLEEDPRLHKLRHLAALHKMILLVGAPIQIKENLYIGAFILYPDQSISIYTKQYLHDGEGTYFKSSFNYNPTIRIGQEKMSLAICADIDHAAHPAEACRIGSDFYLASIFFTAKGIDSGHQTLRRYAKEHSMNILMANYCGPSWNLPAGGKSAFWNKEGELIASLNDTDSDLLLIERKNEKWQIKMN